MSQPQKMSSTTALQKLLLHSGMWRASQQFAATGCHGIPTGYEKLDQNLPGSGWPFDGLTELLHDKPGIGEFRLVSPALARLSQQQNRWLLWVSPPHIPYAPALAQAGINLAKVLIVKPKTASDTLWVLEKALASKSCSAVLSWPQNIREKQLRRLQVACKEGSCFGILYRQSSAALNASPAELRIRLHARPFPTASPFNDHSSLQVEIIKRKGGWATNQFTIEFNDQLNQITPDFSELTVNNRAGSNSLSTDKNNVLNHRPLINNSVTVLQ